MVDIGGISNGLKERLDSMPHLGGGSPMTLMVRRHGWQAAVALEFLVALFVWWFFTVIAPILSAAVMPPPASVWEELRFLFVTGQVYSNTLFTLQSFVLGFIGAILISVPSGLVIGSSRLIELFAGPPMWAAYAVPTMAFAPIFVLIFGMGLQSKIVLVFLMSAFPILINTVQGVKSVDPLLVRAGQVYGGSRLEIAKTVVLPSVLPYILAGLRIGMAAGIAGALIGEFIGSFEGLGMLLARAAFNFEISRALALIVIVVLLAQGLMSVIQFAKKRLAPWDDSSWT